MPGSGVEPQGASKYTVPYPIEDASGRAYVAQKPKAMPISSPQRHGDHGETLWDKWMRRNADAAGEMAGRAGPLLAVRFNHEPHGRRERATGGGMRDRGQPRNTRNMRKAGRAGERIGSKRLCLPWGTTLRRRQAFERGETRRQDSACHLFSPISRISRFHHLFPPPDPPSRGSAFTGRRSPNAPTLLRFYASMRPPTARCVSPMNVDAGENRRDTPLKTRNSPSSP